MTDINIISDKDIFFMNRALELARQGEGLAFPNPMVGAVLVNGDEIVGEGFHLFSNLKHAEIVAIDNAGSLAKGATLYCSLEPCCHWGRTPPCTDALINAGIARAFIAIIDNDARVSGKGIQQLRDAGIAVHIGICEHEAYELNKTYFISRSESKK
ncbi:MAG: bifunctional diaminohydroxyphosphoribosylaminopyrimidine deaminase/5-amino-6-(5-phosphoribosylamino)uracil reductase RibD [Acidobacteriota bacterium]